MGVSVTRGDSVSDGRLLFFPFWYPSPYLCLLQTYYNYGIGEYCENNYFCMVYRIVKREDRQSRQLIKRIEWKQNTAARKCGNSITWLNLKEARQKIKDSSVKPQSDWKVSQFDIPRKFMPPLLFGTLFFRDNSTWIRRMSASRDLLHTTQKLRFIVPLLVHWFVDWYPSRPTHANPNGKLFIKQGNWLAK